MARCEDCNKFVSFDEPQAEVESDDIISGEVCIDVRVVLPCAECSTEIKETTLVYEETVECPTCGQDHLDELSIEDANATGQEIYEDAFSPKTGKKLKHQTKYYGAEVTFMLCCERCGESEEHTGYVKELPSSFDDC